MMKQVLTQVILRLRKPPILYLTGLILISLGTYQLDQRFILPRGLEGKYYTNRTWQGNPQLVTLDPEISKGLLKDRRSRLSTNRFSVEWRGFVRIEKSGEYTFATASDDGSWLYVDNQLVVNNGGVHGLQEVKGQINLEAGIYPIRVLYFQAGGYYRMEVLWARGDGPLKGVPSYVLSPQPVNYWDYKFRRGLDHFVMFLKFMWLGTLIYFIGVYGFRWIFAYKLYPLSYEIGLIALLFILLVVTFFYDVAFLGKTLLATNSMPATMMPGAYNYRGYRPPAWHVIDPAASVQEHEPITHLTSLLYKRGIVPLWNPHAATGMPLNADMISTVFFPLSFLLYLDPRAWMWDLLMLTRIFIAGLLAYIFFRRSVEFSILGALTGAIGYMFCGHLIWHINIVFIHAAMLLPGLLYFTDQLARQRSWRNVCLTGSMIGLLILGGHPEPSFFALFYASIYYLIRLLWGYGNRRVWEKTPTLPDSHTPLLRTITAGLAIWSSAVALGLMLSAIMVLPFLEFVTLSPLGIHDPAHKVGRVYLPLVDLILLVIPYFWGPLHRSFREVNWQFEPGYLGVVVALLVLLTFLERTAFTKRLIFFTGMTLFFILKGYGIPPALSHLVGSLPFFDVSFFTRYFAPEFLFSTAALAGFQIYRIQQGKSHVKLLVGLTFLTPILLGFLIWFHASEFTKPEHPLEKTLWQIVLPGAICLVLGVGGLLTLRGVLSLRHLAWLGCLGLGIELFWLVPRYHFDRYEPFTEPPYVTFLKNDPGVFRVYGLDGYFYPNTASAYELNDIGFVNGLVINRFHEAAQSLIDKNLSQWFFTGSSPFGGTRNLGNRILDLLNLKYVVTAPTGEDPQYHLDSYSDVYTYGLVDHGELIKGRRVGQTFKANEDNLVAISLLFSRYLRLFEGEAVFRLKETPDDPTDIYTGRIDMAQVWELHHHLVTFPPIANSKGRWFYFEVSVPEGQPGKTLTLLANERDVYLEGQAYIDGKPVAGDFGFKVYTLSSHASFDKIYQGEVKVYRNNNVFPRAFLAHQVEIIPDKEKVLARLKEEDFDLRSTIILEEEPEGEWEYGGMGVWKYGSESAAFSTLLPSHTSTLPFQATEPVQILHYDPTRITIKAQLEHPGFLVLVDPYYPGWRAYVDGQERKIYLTNYFLRSVFLEEGSHQVEFRYEPTSYKVGAWLTLMGLSVLVATLSLSRRRGGRKGANLLN